MTHALYDLASMPEYIAPLREEVEAIIATDGWTKNALAKMWKVDSFLKESMRLADGSLRKSPSAAHPEYALAADDDDCASHSQ